MVSDQGITQAYPASASKAGYWPPPCDTGAEGGFGAGPAPCDIGSGGAGGGAGMADPP